MSTLQYYSTKKSSSGKLWLNSGIHGDELSIVEPLQHLVQSWESQLPSFVFVPIMSPSAAERKTRFNQSNHDLNRLFGTNSTDPELLTIVQLVQTEGPFDLAVSFHEDTEYEAAYFYDTGIPFYQLELDEWQKALRTTGIELLNGIDDPTDPVLGKAFLDGYHQETHTLVQGVFEYWLIKEQLAKRSLTIEIPTSLPTDKKSYIIEQTLRHLVLPAFI